jgi:hypothetical protein
VEDYVRRKRHPFLGWLAEHPILYILLWLFVGIPLGTLLLWFLLSLI